MGSGNLSGAVTGAPGATRRRRLRSGIRQPRRASRTNRRFSENPGEFAYYSPSQPIDKDYNTKVEFCNRENREVTSSNVAVDVKNSWRQVYNVLIIA